MRQSSMKLCSKAFIQQSIKYMVAPRKSNASVVEFYGSGQPPPLLTLSKDNRCYFSCTSIEHMILYLSVLALCNLLQIYVLYQGPPVIHYELCLSI